mgnify:CR=1 FL=1
MLLLKKSKWDIDNELKKFKKALLYIKENNSYSQLLDKVKKTIKYDKIVWLKKKYSLYQTFVLFSLKKNSYTNNNRFRLFFTKSNMYLSLISNKILLYGLSIGEYQTMIGPNRALWKKKNNKYKKLMFEFFYKLIIYLNLTFKYIIVKNLKNTFFLFIKYLKKIKYKHLLIKDTVFYTIIKQKKKTYIKRRISRKLTYINPLKM